MLHLIHEAANKAGEDPDRTSYVRAVRIKRGRIFHPGALPPSRPASREIDEILGEHAVSGRGQVKARGVRR